MIEHIQLINFPSNFSVPLDENFQYFFKLNTCQRKLLLGFKTKDHDLLQSLHWQGLEVSPQEFDYREGESAYSYLLEILCGLKSKILGETEIVAQFKESYVNYLQSPFRQSEMLKIIEKLLKDTKEIRTKYLGEVCQKAYASFAKKILVKSLNEVENKSPVLIVGTGQLAQDLINQLKKKNDLYITGRNPLKVAHLAQQFTLQISPWENLSSQIFFKYIFCAIGPEQPLYKESFFQKWYQLHQGKGIFVDFGGNSAVETSMGINEQIFRLDDVFEYAQNRNNNSQLKIRSALEAIRKLTKYRNSTFLQKQQNTL